MYYHSYPELSVSVHPDSRKVPGGGPGPMTISINPGPIVLLLIPLPNLSRCELMSIDKFKT